jgi:SAM-dependent methyltransferase
MRVDYDTIADRYDVPERDYEVDPNLLAYLSIHPGPASALRVLDVGCGTGKQLTADHRMLPEVRKVGLDRSGGMLQLARARCPQLAWIQGSGSTLPLASGSFDYVTSQFSYQHIGRTRDLLLEVFRILRPGGRFVMTNIDPWSMPGWAVYRYFPEAFERDCRDFVPVDRFVALLRDAGFERLTVRRENRPWRKTLGELEAFAREPHRASQLMAIPAAAYEAGLRRLRDDAERAGRDDAPREYDFVLVTAAGDRATGQGAT